MKKNILFFIFVILLFSCNKKEKTVENNIQKESELNVNVNINQTTKDTMKVLLINGSPNEKGCTYTALTEVAKELNKEGILTEIVHIGKTSIQGCIDCGVCKGSDKCVFENDIVNVIIEKAKTSDAFVFGSPVYYSGPNGSLISILNRAFYSASEHFAYKPAAAVASARRAGTISTLDQLNKYFTINNMPVVSSQYWNMVYGNTPEEVLQDKEGMQIMRTLGKNMAWILKSIDAGKKVGITIPKPEEEKQTTNFIR